MTCREFIDFLMAYLDGELDPERRAVFVEHLQACPECEVYLDTYRQAVALGRSACDLGDPGAPVPEEVPEPLVRAILAARARGADPGEDA